MTRFVNLIAIGCVLAPVAVIAQVTPDPTQDEETIRKVVADYVSAFNKQDANELAGYWSPEAVYANRITGEQVVGRPAIQQQFEELFKSQNDLKLDVSIKEIQFISPNVAAEHGVATLLAPEAEPEEIEYTAVYVRREGKWLLDRVTDKASLATPSHYEQMKDLEWMIGSWVDEDENARIVTDCNWTKNNNFMTRSFTVTVGNQIDVSGMQIVGWDPAAKQIRSWTFDSNGGFAEGKWSRKEDRWYIHKTGVLQDGGQAVAVNIINRVDEDTFTLQSVNRTVDGELLPNIDEVRVVRQQ